MQAVHVGPTVGVPRKMVQANSVAIVFAPMLRATDGDAADATGIFESHTTISFVLFMH